MNFGKNIKINIENIDEGTKLTISNYPKNISITALDFGKALAKRNIEGYSPNPKEEIDVIQGIDKELTTGEDIIFLYTLGTVYSCLILAGVLAQKLINFKINVLPLEIGGISAGDKNEAYIRVAIQKMIITKDSLGSSLEFVLPNSIDFSAFKKYFTSLSLEIIPEISAIEFGFGKNIVKKSLSNLNYSANRIQITFAPHIQGEIPALALVHEILIESIIYLTIINI